MNSLTVSVIQRQLASATAEDLPALVRRFRSDSRPGVVDAVARAKRRLDRATVEEQRIAALATQERALVDGGMLIVAGVDEVGRGALAGPVTAGACVFHRDTMIPGLDDSKRLTAPVREQLHAIIQRTALAVSVGHAQAGEIDALGIAMAVVLAMRRALDGLGVGVEHVLVDGRLVDLGRPATAIIKGDRSVRAIAAASVYAKVSRDRLMAELDSVYPAYGFASNKGYGSCDHIAALTHIGPSPAHRMSFAPCCQPHLF